MALTATLHNFEIALSDSDRGVYETLELRVARHPSETMRYLLTRTLAYCLSWEDSIAFSKGLSTVDEPAVWIRELDGRVKLWIEIGHPSAERLHKASKAAQQVVVYTHLDLPNLQRAAVGERIHRAQDIQLVGLPAALLDQLAEVTERRTRWELVHTGGHLYITSDGHSFDGAVNRQPLVSEA